MSPTQFLARLCALIPPPRHLLVRFHGVFAPHSSWRRHVVALAHGNSPACEKGEAPACLKESASDTRIDGALLLKRVHDVGRFGLSLRRAPQRHSADHNRKGLRARAIPHSLDEVKVWVVEDNGALRDSLSLAIRELRPPIALTGCFANAEDALAALGRGDIPQAGLIDLGLPGMSGNELIASVLERCPEVALIAVTVRSDDVAIFDALRAGAVGHLLKESSLAAIEAALYMAVEGGSPMSPSVARRLVRRLQPDPVRGAVFRLTARERQVLEELCSGGSYRDVAATLDIAEGTVQSHVKKVYDKLGATSKAEAVRIALEWRLVPLRLATS